MQGLARHISLQAISIHRSKEEIAEYGLGFMVHDKQIRPLCGSIANNEEQLFGYEVTVYKNTAAAASTLGKNN